MIRQWKRWWLLATLAGVSVACLACFSLTRQTHDRWVATVQRPGYRLLYKSETSDWYIALFDGGNSYLAICHKFIGKGIEPNTKSYDVTDELGVELFHRDAANRFNELLRNVGMPGFPYIVSDGLMYPVRPNYRGSMRIVVRSGVDNDSANVVFETKLQWSGGQATEDVKRSIVPMHPERIGDDWKGYVR